MRHKNSHTNAENTELPSLHYYFVYTYLKQLFLDDSSDFYAIMANAATIGNPEEMLDKFLTDSWLALKNKARWKNDGLRRNHLLPKPEGEWDSGGEPNFISMGRKADPPALLEQLIIMPEPYKSPEAAAIMLVTYRDHARVFTCELARQDVPAPYFVCELTQDSHLNYGVISDFQEFINSVTEICADHENAEVWSDDKHIYHSTPTTPELVEHFKRQGDNFSRKGDYTAAGGSYLQAFDAGDFNAIISLEKMARSIKDGRVAKKWNRIIRERLEAAAETGNVDAIIMLERYPKEVTPVVSAKAPEITDGKRQHSDNLHSTPASNVHKSRSQSKASAEKEPRFTHYVFAACTPYATLYISECKYDKKSDSHTISISSALSSAMKFKASKDYPDWADSAIVEGVTTPLWAIPLDEEGKPQKKYAVPTFPNNSDND